MDQTLYTSNFKNLIKVLVFGALLFFSVVATIYFIGGKYYQVANKNTVNAHSNQRFEDFYALPENSLDMVFVGSSHAYCSFDPENFDKMLGTSSFQMGMPLQHPDATYYTLREVFEYQSPKYVVVEVYWDMLDDPGDMKQAVTLFDSLKNKQLENEYVNEVFSPADKIKYSINVFNYQKDYFNFKTTEWKNSLKVRFGVKDFEEKQQGDEHYAAKGYVYCDYQMLTAEYGKTNQYNSYDGRTFEINDTQRKYIERIASLCKEKGAEVIFVTAPIANISLEKIKNYGLVNKQVSDMAKTLGVLYIDYNMPETRKNMFDNSNFRDDAHLNDSGVKILDKDFASWLLENLQIATVSS